MGRIYDRGHDGGDAWRWETLERFVKENNWTVGAELGTWEGHTFRHLIQSCPNLTMVGVDLYAAQPDNPGPEKWTPGENGHSWNHNQYFEDIAAFCEQHKGRAFFIRGLTTEAAKLVDDGALDFVFIDADHSFEGVDNDIVAWSPKVKSGGYIIGHDIHFPTVNAAVKKHYGDDFKTADDFIWYHVKG